MKTLTKTFLAFIIGGVLQAGAIAGPGPQYWSHSETASNVSAKPASRVATCTPEMMKKMQTGSCCQQACVKATKG